MFLLQNRHNKIVGYFIKFINYTPPPPSEKNAPKTSQKAEQGYFNNHDNVKQKMFFIFFFNHTCSASKLIIGLFWRIDLLQNLRRPFNLQRLEYLSQTFFINPGWEHAENFKFYYMFIQNSSWNILCISCRVCLELFISKILHLRPLPPDLMVAPNHTSAIIWVIICFKYLKYGPSWKITAALAERQIVRDLTFLITMVSLSDHCFRDNLRTCQYWKIKHNQNGQ